MAIDFKKLMDQNAEAPNENTAAPIDDGKTDEELENFFGLKSGAKGGRYVTNEDMGGRKKTVFFLEDEMECILDTYTWKGKSIEGIKVLFPRVVVFNGVTVEKDMEDVYHKFNAYHFNRIFGEHEDSPCNPQTTYDKALLALKQLERTAPGSKEEPARISIGVSLNETHRKGQPGVALQNGFFQEIKKGAKALIYGGHRTSSQDGNSSHWYDVTTLTEQDLKSVGL